MASRSGLRVGRALAVAILCTAALSGCGRRGLPLPPPDPAVGAVTPDRDAAQPLGHRPKNPPIVPPKTPFILDPLL